MPLHVRELACGCCGLATARDANAARNFLRRRIAPAGWDVGTSGRPGASESVLEPHVAGMPGQDAERCVRLTDGLSCISRILRLSRPWRDRGGLGRRSGGRRGETVRAGTAALKGLASGVPLRNSTFPRTFRKTAWTRPTADAARAIMFLRRCVKAWCSMSRLEQARGLVGAAERETCRRRAAWARYEPRPNGLQGHHGHATGSGEPERFLPGRQVQRGRRVRAPDFRIFLVVGRRAIDARRNSDSPHCRGGAGRVTPLRGRVVRAAGVR